jgi:hypothetical protein
MKTTAEGMLDQAVHRASARLETVAAVAQHNALLSLADPALVLPSPAMGLLVVEPMESRRLGPQHRFRSMGHAGPAGDLLFTALDPSFEVQPWRVRSTRWIGPACVAHANRIEPGRLAVGIELRLERDPAVPCGPGWLALFLEGGPCLAWALESCAVRSNEARLRARRATEAITAAGAMPAASWPAWHVVGALTTQLLHVEIPLALVRDPQLVLQIDFSEPILASDGPRAESNVALVWNSLAHVHPDPLDVESRVSQRRDQHVFPLVPRSLGPRWAPWVVDHVRPTDARSSLAPHLPDARGIAGDDPEYRLRFVPASDTQSAPQLSVVLGPRGRERLDRSSQRLEVSFRATQGAAARHVPANTSFELVDRADAFGSGIASCRLLGDTLGGSDGLGGAVSNSDPSELVAFLAPGRTRTVTDVQVVLRHRFGDEIELVDAWDLLRATDEPAGGSLTVRIRFLRAHRPPAERRAILEACGSFLRHYLGSAPWTELRLVDVEAPAGGVS